MTVEQIQGVAHKQGSNSKIASRNTLVEANMALARSAARRAKWRFPPSVELDDLYQSAVVGLIDAADRFDCTFGTSFEAYASKRIWGAMFESVRRRRYRDNTHLPLAQIVDLLAVDDAIEAKIATDEQRVLVRRLLDRLPRRQAILMILRYWYGMTFEQIAREFRIGLTSAFQLHSLAIDELRREIRRCMYVSGSRYLLPR